MRVRSKRDAERQAHDINDEMTWQERKRIIRTTGPYHSFGIEGIAAQVVCHLCSAVVVDREIHTAWHADLGQEMPS